MFHRTPTVEVHHGGYFLASIFGTISGTSLSSFLTISAHNFEVPRPALGFSFQNTAAAHGPAMPREVEGSHCSWHTENIFGYVASNEYDELAYRAAPGFLELPNSYGRLLTPKGLVGWWLDVNLASHQRDLAS